MTSHPSSSGEKFVLLAKKIRREPCNNQTISYSHARERRDDATR
jgi:hypothetical protein